MAESTKVVGIDGCPGGWLAVSRTLSSWQPPEVKVFATFADLILHHAQADLLLIDMPIGLPYAGKRRCDSEARQRLTGKRSSSIFPVPCRAATRADTYQEANRLNREWLGVGLSRQSWNICPKIRELDQWLQTHPAWREKIRESHPEVCFWALNGGGPMVHYKKQHDGRIERQRLLTRHWPQSEATYVQALAAFPRKLFQPDDLLDALVLALTASVPEQLASLPAAPELDETGLPMEIVYSSRWLK